MTRQEILVSLQASLAEAFELDPSAVTMGARLREELGLDSIDAIDLSVRMRPMTGRKMTDEELRGLRTIADLVALIDRIRREP